jgi:hypothetical protein
MGEIVDRGISEEHIAKERPKRFEPPAVPEQTKKPQEGTHTNLLLADLRIRYHTEEASAQATGLYDMLDFFKARREDTKNKDTDETLKNMQDTVLSITINAEVTEEAVDRIASYLSDNFDFWNKKSQEAENPKEKELAEETKDIFAVFDEVLHDTQNREEIAFEELEHEEEPIKSHPPEVVTFQLKPEKANKVVESLTDKRRATLDDLAGFYEALEDDFIRQTDEQKDDEAMQRYNDVVAVATGFYEQNKDEALSGKVIYITTHEDGSMTGAGAQWSSDAEATDATYITFDPLAPLEDPTSLSYHARLADEIPLEAERLQKAQAVVKKLETRQKIDDDEHLVLVQLVEQYATAHEDGQKKLFATIQKEVEPMGVRRFLRKGKLLRKK